MALHIGYQRAGLAGLAVAGLAFITPAAILTALLAAAYVRWGALPPARAVLYGLDPVILVVVLVALVRLVPSAVRRPAAAIAAVAACGGALAGVHELLLLVTGAAIGGAGALVRRLARGDVTAALWAPGVVGALSAAAVTPAGSATTAGLFLIFLKVGSVLYGSGYVLLAFLRAELVERRAWLTDGQLLDAIAAGQITPGPLFSTATFVGYLLSGPSGAVAATVGIFAPAFLFVVVSGPLVRFLRASPPARALLDGVTAASLGLMAAVWLQLAGAALVDGPTVALAAVAAAALAFRVNPGWCLLAGALAGLLLRGGLT
jgi:chromate transporter